MIAKLGAKSAVALASGTAAIHLALKTAGVEQGDFVFCQSLTFSATANPIVYEKAVPVFIDSDESTWNMSPIALQKAFDKYEKLGKLPKAVIVVHLYGICAHIEEIAEICKKYNVPLIEDAAESLGTAYKGKYTGTFGDYGIISFNGNKIITTSGGGMLLFNTADAKERAAKALFWATQARDAARWYQHSEIGYNYRMSNVVAGIGRGQLKVLDQRIEKKRYIYEYYKKHLGRLKGVSLMPQGEEERSNCWLTAIQLSDDCKVKPIDIMLTLEEDDVESRPVWKPLHLQPFFGECDFISDVQELYITDEEMGADNSIAGSIFRKGVCMPSDSKMTDEDLERICGIVKELWV
jgi:dTDP-4-amino-4,6-dideoxygalactose transaminase